MRNLEKQLKFFKFTAIFLLLLIIVGVVLGYFFVPKFLLTFCPKQIQEDLSQKAKPTAQTKIEKTFEFPVAKFSLEKFKVKIVKAEKVKMVTTKGEPVLPKKGEDFLLLYLEIENSKETPITVDSQTYFRLLSDDKKLAPDFYNGQIEVAPISTKKDQIGFVVAETQKNFKLQVGEIEGKKEVVEIKF